MSEPDTTEGPLAAPRPQPALVLPEGLEAGLLGGFAVVAVYFVGDFLAGDAFRTPTVIGTLLFGGAQAAREVGEAPGLAAGYHLVHFGVWVLAGLGASALTTLAELRQLRFLPWIALFVYLVGLMALDAWVHGAGLGRQHLWLGGLAGALASGAFLAWRHPGAFVAR